MTKLIRNLKGLSLTLVTSVLLIFLGIVYFMLTIWTIKIGANWAGFKNVSGSIIVLTTGIVSAAAIIGSAIQH